MSTDAGRNRLRIAIAGDCLPRNMSYIGAMLPRYLARHQADVHYVTPDLPPYWQRRDVAERYAELIGREWLRPGRWDDYDGYTLHVLPHRRLGRLAQVKGLRARLREIEPDVVYSLMAVGPIPLDCAMYCAVRGVPLFTGSHMLTSSFPLARARRPWLSARGASAFLARWLPGRLISLLTERCYAPTIDAAMIARRFFGVQSGKIEVQFLGVDTDVFFPATDSAHAAERHDVRHRLGYSADDLLCIYTGKLTREKNVTLLAEVVTDLRAKGKPHRLVCVGAGPERESLAKFRDVKLLDFRPYQELAPLYRAADIAVWPGTETTSMLDAAACGLPLVVSDGIVYRDHVDGNGLVCRLDDAADLASKLMMLEDAEYRYELGRAGAEKMLRRFSWLEISRKRLEDFEAAVAARRRRQPAS